ncbi:hypothetical protein K7711_44115 [Nocardia sp. CA2R105]|uniref:hypothetical protein n=1 Tax=Nocardia coffeae TaxID=2873381 RepID=UPI001CA604B9|nr:hypothetical protein [Nocardia coffeae]MBY8863519.1 hypothetical protein [Nocardia coffeae]
MSRLVRLNPTDEMLAAAARSVGATRRIQFVWALPRRLDRARVDEFWQRLDRGVLSRRPSAPLVPGARRWWAAAPNAQRPIVMDPGPGAPILDWLDQQVRVPLDADRLWSLAYRPTEAGSVVALTVPHSLVDGVGLLRAIEAAGNPETDSLPDRPRCADDVADIADQLVGGLRDTVRWTGRVRRDASLRASLVQAIRSRGVGRVATEGAAPQFFSTAFCTVSARDWQAAADASGGTVNSLFITFAERLYRTAVDRIGDGPLDIGIPVSLRAGPGDLSANALVVVPMRIAAGGSTARQIRVLARERLERSSPEDITLVPQSIWHHLPRGLAAALKTPGAQFTDVVASNFGAAGDSVARALDGQGASKVFVRTMSVPGVVPGRARLRLSLCMIRLGDTLSVSVTGIPDHFGSSDRLADTADLVLRDLPVRAEKWTVT